MSKTAPNSAGETALNDAILRHEKMLYCRQKLRAEIYGSTRIREVGQVSIPAILGDNGLERRLRKPPYTGIIPRVVARFTVIYPANLS